jgi:putative endonuclease
VKNLAYYEIHNSIYEAIKKWFRKWKVELIEKNNPGWKDLYADITN